MFHVILHRPEIPPNTGNAIRLCANTGAQLHLVRPLGFELEDRQLKRAGLDYHEYARMQVHPDLDTAMAALPGRVFAFTGHSSERFDQVTYERGDALLFGPEPDGLPEEVMAHPHVTGRLRIPMVPGVRSLNLANAAAIATYEAWRQMGYPGGV